MRQVYVMIVEVEGSSSQIDEEHKLIMPILSKAQESFNGNGARTQLRYFNPSFAAQFYTEIGKMMVSFGRMARPYVVAAKNETVKALKDAW